MKLKVRVVEGATSNFEGENEISLFPMLFFTIYSKIMVDKVEYL